MPGDPRYTEQEQARMDAAEDAHIRYMSGEPSMWPAWSKSSQEQWLETHGEDQWDIYGEDDQ